MRALGVDAPRVATSPLRGVAKYAAVARVTLATQTAYVGEVAVRALFLAMILYVFVQLWTVTYEAMGSAVVAGFSLPQMVWYLMVTESILLSRPRVTQEIDEQVRSGDVAYQLIRPYDYLAFRLAAYAAERLLRLGLGLAAGTVLALVLVGPVPLRPEALAAAGIVLAIGALVDFLGAVAIGLCAFWIEDTTPLTLLYDRAIMLLGGLLLPLELFPDALAAVLGVLPFQLLLYAPARLAITGDLAPLPSVMAQLALAVGAMLLIARLVFGVAQRRLHANGG